jgi:polyhydroxyalkanoate synthesis regulator protein
MKKRDRDVAGTEPRHGPVFVKRYAGQRLCRPAAGTYLIRGDLMTMVKNADKNSSSSTPGTGGVTLLYHPIIVEH